jgi:hypothetical protein
MGIEVRFYQIGDGYCNNLAFLEPVVPLRKMADKNRPASMESWSNLPDPRYTPAQQNPPGSEGAWRLSGALRSVCVAHGHG